MTEGYRRFLRELDVDDYIDWCIKSSPDPKETVECFQEIVPICRFDENCKEKLLKYAKDNGLDFDVETGNINFNTYGYGNLEFKQMKGKTLVESYLEYLQYPSKEVLQEIIFFKQEVIKIADTCTMKYRKEIGIGRKKLLAFALQPIIGPIALMFTSSGRLIRYAKIQCLLKGMRSVLLKFGPKEQGKKNRYQKHINKLIKERQMIEKILGDKIMKLEEKSKTSEYWKAKPWYEAVLRIYKKIKSETP